MASTKMGRRVRASNLALYYKPSTEDGPDMCGQALRGVNWEQDSSPAISSMLKRRWAQKFLDALPEPLFREWVRNEWFDLESARDVLQQ